MYLFDLLFFFLKCVFFVAPKLPPRPEPKNKFATDFAAQLKLYAQSSYQDRYEQHKLLNMVPPPAPPSNDHRSTAGSELFASSNHFATPLAASSTTSTTSGPILTPVPLSPSRVPSSVFSSFQENLLYSMPSSQATPALPCKSIHPSTSNGSLPKPPSAVRPTRIISPPGTLRRDSELIDLTSLSLNDLSEEGRQSEERERKNQTIQMIKSMITGQPSSPQHSVPGTPVLSPLGVPINVPTMSPLAVQQVRPNFCILSVSLYLNDCLNLCSHLLSAFLAFFTLTHFPLSYNTNPIS